jgi:hypothetical protein
MSLFKNTSGQKVRVFAFDATTGLPKTGDAANITGSVSKDFGAFADLADTSATEEDSTKAKGYYLLDISQTETNADDIGIGGRSATSNIVVVGAPARIATRPPNAGALVISSAGIVQSDVAKINGVTASAVTTIGANVGTTQPVNFTGTSSSALVKTDTIDVGGTAQTARDLGASVLLSSGTGTGQISLSSGKVSLSATQTFDNTGTWTGNLSGSVGSLSGITFPTNFSALGINASGHISRVVLVDTITTYTGNTPQTGDNFAIVNSGTFGNAAIKSSVGTVQSTASTIEATVDNVVYGNSALLTAINANLTAINNINNLSALANIYGPPILEIPDSSSTLYPFTLIVRDSEGHLADLDSSPTLAAINAAGTDRSANLSSVTHAATGRYTFTYSVASNATEEGLRISATGAVSSSARYVEIIVAVANYDSITTLAAIKAKTDNLPADPASEASATTNKNSIITKLSDGTITLNAAYDAAKTAAGATAVAAITAVLSGITSLKQWLGMLAGKQTGDSTALTEIRATGAGSGTFNPTTDSGEALRDRGDAAWTTGTGGGGGGGGTTVVAGALIAQLNTRTFTTMGGAVQALSIAQSEGKTLVFLAQINNDGDATPYDLTGKTVVFSVFEKADDGEIVFSKSTDDASITLSASDGAAPSVLDQVNVDIDTTDTADKGAWLWELRVTTDDNAYLAGGEWVVRRAPIA